MTISYKWLSEYLPEHIEPEQLSVILTSIGLEVESLERYESIKGGLEGVIVGKVEDVQQHPNADKLKLTRVNIGNDMLLNIVCGAANVAKGQHVLVATVGSTIYPTEGNPITLKAAKIRGEESHGMICAEDELGLGNSHDGIMILPDNIPVGTKAGDYFKVYTDWIYEIGLTPNRMDAMSHYGVAKDVCAYLSHHNKRDIKPVNPLNNNFAADENTMPISISIEDDTQCKRYAGVTIKGVEVKESPKWLKDKLKAIGQKPINNIVDITNFILHETGQPLHAFDADAIEDKCIVVRKARAGETFITLDNKERSLDAADLMICNINEPMCIAGVFGGAKSGISNSTKNIFIESAWFNPGSIRKTSFRHGLRTEAATRFEKGVDISAVANVLKRAALLIKEVAGGKISSDIIDVYPNIEPKNEVTLKHQYLKKLSGKNYHPDTVKRILNALSFEIIEESIDEIRVAVPYSKPDISLPADIVEEILRIDGLDNIEISGAFMLTPSIDNNLLKESLKEKISGYLTGLGFSEIVTNSIINSNYYQPEELETSVKMMNSLSADLDIMRPSMIESGLEVIAYNINRKNKDLLLFEFGKTYHSGQVGKYTENERLTIYITGNAINASWKSKEVKTDFYYTKGIAQAVTTLCGLSALRFSGSENATLQNSLIGTIRKQELVTVSEISLKKLQMLDIKQPVYVADFDFNTLLTLVGQQKITYKEVSKFPAVQRDLSMVIDKGITYEMAENVVRNLNISKLQYMQLFDIFESEKLGTNKKSMAVSFLLQDDTKTLTDKETDEIMNQLISSFEKELSAEIRKS